VYDSQDWQVIEEDQGYQEEFSENGFIWQLVIYYNIDYHGVSLGWL
jgi:hypothetical protein